MNDRYLSRQYSVATAVMIALGVTPTLGAESRDELEEIVVTAQFREQNLQDTPIAITAVTAEMLELRSQNNIYQVAAQAPNVSLAPQGQGNGSGIIAFIRGVGQTDFNFALEPGVGLYIDDVYYSTLTGSLVDLTDLERVEVLRGPQGTLAGRIPSVARSSCSRANRRARVARCRSPTASSTASMPVAWPTSRSPKTSCSCAWPAFRRTAMALSIASTMPARTPVPACPPRA
ncbi:MAG: Plug domain-containing protein [Proteobacteria bacterium]|nr:Plug domain-containing protein [Pseudomonadota bacterium]